MIEVSHPAGTNRGSVDSGYAATPGLPTSSNTFRYATLGFGCSLLLFPVGALLLMSGGGGHDVFLPFLCSGHPLLGLAATFGFALHAPGLIAALLFLLWPMEWMLYGYLLDLSLAHTRLPR